MKVVKRIEMRVTLKIGNGRIIPFGEVFTDEHAPIPDFVYRRLKRGMARELSDLNIPSPEDKKEVPAPKKEKVLPKVSKETAPEVKPGKRVLLRKTS